MEADDLHWFALRTRPQTELVSQDIMQRRGFITFVPVREVYRRRNKYTRVKELRKFPLLVGYVLFGSHVPDPVWFDVFKLKTIKSVVGVRGEPREIDHTSIARLMKLQGVNYFTAPREQRFMRSRQEFSVGDIVEVVDGPLSGNFLKVEEIRGEKAKAMLNFLGRPTQVQVALDNLIPA